MFEGENINKEVEEIERTVNSHTTTLKTILETVQRIEQDEKDNSGKLDTALSMLVSQAGLIDQILAQVLPSGPGQASSQKIVFGVPQ